MFNNGHWFDCIPSSLRDNSARFPRPDSDASSSHRLTGLDGQHGSGHPDPDFRSSSLNTTSNRATAPPDAGIPLATGSTTSADRSADHRSESAGTASLPSPNECFLVEGTTLGVHLG